MEWLPVLPIVISLMEKLRFLNPLFRKVAAVKMWPLARRERHVWSWRDSDIKEIEERYGELEEIVDSRFAVRECPAQRSALDTTRTHPVDPDELVALDFLWHRMSNYVTQHGRWTSGHIDAGQTVFPGRSFMYIDYYTDGVVISSIMGEECIGAGLRRAYPPQEQDPHPPRG